MEFKGDAPGEREKRSPEIVGDGEVRRETEPKGQGDRVPGRELARARIGLGTQPLGQRKRRDEGQCYQEPGRTKSMHSWSRQTGSLDSSVVEAACEPRLVPITLGAIVRRAVHPRFPPVNRADIGAGE